MNALTEAARMLGDMELSPGQLAQLRALDRKYAQRRFEGRRPEADLLELLRSDILAMLTPEQQRALLLTRPSPRSG
jgi:hypothetical protein